MRQRGARYKTALAALALLAVVAAARPAHGAHGFTLSLPLAPNPPVKGLSMVFDCTWPSGPGYMPVRITVQCTPPAAANRTLTVEITNEARSEYRAVTMTTDIEIPAGATSASVIVPYQRLSQSNQLSMHVYEDGRQIDELSFEDMSLFTATVGQQAAPATLFVAPAPVDISTLEFMVGANTFQGNTVTTFTPQGMAVARAPTTTTAQSATIAQVAPFATMPASQLFEDWINYSSLDVIFISLDDVNNLAANRPRVWQALRRWTHAGGNLCVYGVGDDWHGLATLDERLKCPPRPADEDKPRRGWQSPKAELFNAHWEISGGGAIAVETPVEEGDRPGGRKPKPPKEPPFLSKDVSMGQVVAVSDTQPFPGKVTTWRWLFATVGPARAKWETRHGVTAGEGTADFDDFLIADVGLPPVKAYRVLITVFVVAIGPVNYWLLRRRGRLHWLLFTVPVAAVLVSLALIGYAVVADGFQTYLRARSFTRLDQRNDEAVSWARLSYYASVAPAGGLKMPLDTAIYPMERDRLHYRAARTTRYGDWLPDQQLTRGWLASRTPTQFTTVRPYACKRELRVLEATDAPACRVENRLDTRINHLMLCDKRGNLYYGAGIERGAKAELTLLNLDEESQPLIVAMLNERNRAALVPPATSATSATDLLFGQPRSNRNFSSRQSYVGPPSSRLEEAIDVAFSEVGAKLSEPGTYVAIVARPPDVVTGVEGMAERQSLHLILGTW